MGTHRGCDCLTLVCVEKLRVNAAPAVETTEAFPPSDEHNVLILEILQTIFIPTA